MGWICPPPGVIYCGMSFLRHKTTVSRLASAATFSIHISPSPFFTCLEDVFIVSVQLSGTLICLYICCLLRPCHASARRLPLSIRNQPSRQPIHVQVGCASALIECGVPVVDSEYLRQGPCIMCAESVMNLTRSVPFSIPYSSSNVPYSSSNLPVPFLFKGKLPVDALVVMQ